MQLAEESYEKERQERESAEASRDVLTVDLERVTHEAKRFSEQVIYHVFTWVCIINPFANCKFCELAENGPRHQQKTSGVQFQLAAIQQ